MENKRLTETESLEIITSMIRDSRSRMARNAGTPFLIWGYVTVAVSLLEAVAMRCFDNPQPWMWAWAAIPVLGYAGMLLFVKKDTGVRNYIDRVTSAVWSVLGITAVVMMITSWFYHLPILFIIVTLIGAGTAITGRIIRDGVVTAAGFLAMASALLFPLRTWLFARLHTAEQMDPMRWNSTNVLIFAAIFLLLMVIPGHILNRKGNRACSRS